MSDAKENDRPGTDDVMELVVDTLLEWLPGYTRLGGDAPQYRVRHVGDGQDRIEIDVRPVDPLGKSGVVSTRFLVRVTVEELKGEK